MNGEQDAPLYDALANRLRAHGLARVVDDVLRLARPAIRLDLTRVEDEADLPLGASKVGGAPDLPADTPWPTANDGTPLPFIAQIHLADITPYDPEDDLPHEGLLSFFYAMNEPGDGGLRVEYDPSAWRVIWTKDGTAPLVRLATPAALMDALDSNFRACSVVFARRLTLPQSESYAVKQIGFTESECQGYITVTMEYGVGYERTYRHQLLGYPYELEPETFALAYQAEHGKEAPIPRDIMEEREEAIRAMARVQEIANRWAAPPGGFTSEEARRHALEGLHREADPEDMRKLYSLGQPMRLPQETVLAMENESRKIEAEWHLLLQVDSDEATEMDWGGGGLIHFGVKRAALAARDFSQVCVSIQFL